MALSRLRAAVAAVAAVASVAGSLGAAVPAAHAHGGGAVFEEVEVDEARAGELHVRVVILHEADGHPAEGAIVEVGATGPGGIAVPTQPAQREEAPGLYTATLPVAEPGEWTVSVTSSFPPGSAEVPVTVAQDDDTITTAAGGGADTADGTPPEEAATEPLEGAAERDNALNLVVAAVFGIIGGALGLWVSNRRSRRRKAAVPREGASEGR